METQRTTYCMTRPRQFGKTIFLDMMASFFAGEEYRFVNLTIYDLVIPRYVASGLRIQ